MDDRRRLISPLETYRIAQSWPDIYPIYPGERCSMHGRDHGSPTALRQDTKAADEAARCGGLTGPSAISPGRVSQERLSSIRRAGVPGEDDSRTVRAERQRSAGIAPHSPEIWGENIGRLLFVHGQRRVFLLSRLFSFNWMSARMSSYPIQQRPIHLALGVTAVVEPEFTGSIEWYAG